MTQPQEKLRTVEWKSHCQAANSPIIKLCHSEKRSDEEFCKLKAAGEGEADFSLRSK